MIGAVFDSDDDNKVIFIGSPESALDFAYYFRKNFTIEPRGWKLHNFDTMTDLENFIGLETCREIW